MSTSAFQEEPIVEGERRRPTTRTIAVAIILVVAATYIGLQVFNGVFRSPTVAAWSECGGKQPIEGAGCLFVAIKSNDGVGRVNACEIDPVYGAKGLGICPANEQFAFTPGIKVKVSVSAGASSVRLIRYAGSLASHVDLKDREVDMKLDQLSDDEMTRGSRFFEFTAPSSPQGEHYAEFELRNGDHRVARVPFIYKPPAGGSTGP